MPAIRYNQDHLKGSVLEMTQRQAALLTVIGLAVVLGIAVFFIGKAFTDDLMALSLYVLVTVIAIIGVRVWAPSARKSKCPNCGRAMLVKDRVTFPGGTDAETGNALPAILERRYLCQQCNYRYHEVMDGEVPEEYWAMHKNEPKPVITLKEWADIKDESTQAAEAKNRKQIERGNKWMF